MMLAKWKKHWPLRRVLELLYLRTEYGWSSRFCSLGVCVFIHHTIACFLPLCMIGLQDDTGERVLEPLCGLILLALTRTVHDKSCDEPFEEALAMRVLPQ